jgi:hypothetical protein
VPSLHPDFIARNVGFGAEYHTVQVPAVPFSELLSEHGVPYYLKIDIEGADMLCVRALHEVGERPDYLSIESAVTNPGAGVEQVFDELAELWTLGYRAFKFIDQNQHPWVDPRFTRLSSGPFGEKTPGPWAPIGRTLARSASLRLQYDIGGYAGRWGETLPGRAFRKLRNDVLHRPLGWYDLHARLERA